MKWNGQVIKIPYSADTLTGSVKEHAVNKQSIRVWYNSFASIRKIESRDEIVKHILIY